VIITGEQNVTEAVLREIERAPSPRFREIMSAAVRHLHAFIRESNLTEAEFQRACAYIAKLGQLTTASHNEVVLTAGSLGLSSLVCLLNNGARGTADTTANLMGPFWRMHSPPTMQGGSIVRSPTAGVPIFVNAWVRDPSGNPVADAEVDVWHASNEGFYENQDPAQADMNLRGKLTTDAQGHVAFRSIKPRGYPIPVSGPVGELLRAQGRHNMRPAHMHFMIYKPDTDVQFGVTGALIGSYVLHDGAHEGVAAADVKGPWYSLDHSFTIEPGEAALPAPPVTDKAQGDRPAITILERSDTLPHGV